MSEKLRGIGPLLPLTYSNTDGPYHLVKILGTEVKQNFKNLLLTSPGERIMIPEFGVGLKRMLFENMSGELNAQIEGLIREKTEEFLPYIYIQEVLFHTSDTDPDMPMNNLGVTIIYNLGALDSTEEITISV